MKKLVAILLTVNIVATIHTMNTDNDNNSSNRSTIQMPERDPLLNAYPTLNAYGYAFDANDPLSIQFMHAISQNRKNNQQTNILEIGPAYGILATKILQETYPNNTCQYTGLDLDKNHLNIATKNITRYTSQSTIWNPHNGAFPDDLTSYKTDSLSFIGAFQVFHFVNIDKIKEGLKTIERILKPKGQVFIYTASSETEVYGPLLPLYCLTRKLLGYELPGYVHDVPAWVKMLVDWKLLPRERAENPTFKKSLAQNFLFFNTKDLCTLVTKNTNLTIVSSQTIHEHQNGKRKSYVGIILEKE